MQWWLGFVLAGGLPLFWILPGHVIAQISTRPPLADSTPPVKSWPVWFESADQVQLSGTFYPSQHGKEAACVLLVHKIGGNSQQEGWDALATELQKQGFAVLRFDFRGHGNSTRVTANFWQLPFNCQLRSQHTDNLISHRDFPPPYYPMLVHDVSAARFLVDRLNDMGECNGANLIVIGAEDGGVLAAMWLMLEWHRHRVQNGQLPAPAPEGKDILGAVWLSLIPVLGNELTGGTKQVPVLNWIAQCGRDRNVPMVFLHGEADSVAANFAQQCIKELKVGSLNSLVGVLAVPRSGPLAGCGLLDGGLKLASMGRDVPVPVWVAEYCSRLRKERPSPPWELRRTDKANFIWKHQGKILPGAKLLPLEITGMR